MAVQGTDEKLRSLRIEPNRKLPSRGTGAVLFLAVGIVIGLGSAVSYQVYRNPDGGAPPANPRSSAGTLPAESKGGASTSTVSAKSSDKSPTARATPAPAAGTVLLTASGYVTPRHRLSLSPQVTGIVAWVGIEKGDVVKKGDVLVRLEDEDYAAQVRSAEAQVAGAKARLAELEAGWRHEEIRRARAQVAESEASLENAEKRLRRAMALVEAGAESSQVVEDAQMNRDTAAARLKVVQESLALYEAGTRAEQIEAARADLAAAEASLEYQRIQLKDTVITAPLDGTVLEKLIEVGELVSPQSYGGSRGARTELLSLADLSDLQVEVDINENDFAKVRPGQLARVTLDAYPDSTYVGRVREIAPEADRTKATIQIKVAIQNPDALVRPEMGARLDLLAGDGGTETAAATTPAAGKPQ